MSRALLVLYSDAMKARAIDWIRKAKKETRVEFKGPKRTLPQNDKMWAMLTDVATQLRWHGKPMVADDWKKVFLDGLNREMRLVPNLDGTGWVNLSNSSSDLSVEEMTNLIELIYAFGANHGVVWSDPAERMQEAEMVA